MMNKFRRISLADRARKVRATAMITFLFCSLSLIPDSVVAQGLIERYTAYIASDDLYNSDGHRLDTASQVLHQDRANVNSAGKRQSGDQPDAIFINYSRRQLLERILNDQFKNVDLRNEIYRGNVMIVVELFGTNLDDPNLTVVVSEYSKNSHDAARRHACTRLQILENNCEGIIF